MTARNVIYGLSSTAEPERGIRYIGLTMQGAEARLREHFRAAPNGTSGCYQWIRRVGAETIVVEVLEVLPDDAELHDLLLREGHWIRHYRTKTTGLLNHQASRASRPPFTRLPPARVLEPAIG